jgi:hypothetical protein
MNDDSTISVTLLDLAQESAERPGWSTVFGAFAAQAASVCLEATGKELKAHLSLDGDYQEVFLVSRQEVDDIARKFHADMQRSAEFAAYGVSALIVPKLTKLTVIEVSKKTTGFDFWLGSVDDTGPLFQRKARLEVSGILQGDTSKIKTRVKTKLEQISPTDNLPYPGFVSVVEFGSFKMVLIQKNGRSS